MDNLRPQSITAPQLLDCAEVTTAINVLIVDDSESDRVSYLRYLQSDSERSYRIIEAETLEEGLELWRSQHPDVVLLDINLPDGDGLEFLEAIGNEQLINKLPVIMLTGSGDERIAVRAMKLGAADYLVKGDVTAVSLLTCIAQVQENSLLIQQLLRSQKQQTVIASMALHIRRAHTFEAVSNTIVQEIRSFLVADRAIIYRFNPDMSGKIVAEAVISPWESCLSAQIEDTCFQENLGGEYQRGKVFAANDIYEANLTECHIQLLERFQVSANLVAPILLNGMNTLWGLLIVHQCDAPRQWQEEDIQLLHQLSIHLAISLYQAELYQNLESLNSSLEEKVQERTKKLQLQSQVLEEIHDGVVTTDLNGTILSWNLGAEKLYGYTEAEVLGRNVAFMYEDAEALGAEVIVPLLDKGSHATEVVIFSKSGKRIYISLRLSVVKDEQGNITHLIGCANDISDRKRAEQELQQLNQELETKVLERTQELAQVNSLQLAILESANYAIISTDLDGIIQTCNHSVERMLGYSASELIGITPDILHDRQEIIDKAASLSAELEQDIPAGFEVFIAKSRRGIVSEQEWTYIRKDGSRFPILLSVTALKNDNQQIIGFLGIAKDITQRKQAEEALRASERRFVSLAAAAPVGIFRIDQNNNCTYVNEFWTQITGQEADVALGYGWLETIHPDDQEQIHQKWTQVLIQQAPYQGEGRAIRPDGTISYYYCQVLPEIDEDGNFIGYIGTLTDISDRKQAEIQLKHINEELLRATKLKDEFLANMSHELRTPLNSILGLSNVLGEQVLGSLNEKQLKAIGTVESSGEHLLSLINDILDLSKISSGMMELNVESVLVKNLCDSSLVFVKQQAFQKQVQIASNIPKNINKINVEERRIRQVLINLLTNAVKFTPSEGQVYILVAVGRGDTWQGEATIPQRIKLMNSPMIVFQVVDTGIGIAANDLQRLFQPFVQVSSSLNRQYEGTGLGLALVKQIVELHGGQVMAESEVGKGSCFLVALPYEMSHSSAPESPTVSTTLPPVVIDPDNAPLILLAEDNEANIQTFSSYLTAINYRIVTARNGEEAVAMAKAESPDIILMDIQMPDMDGLEAIALIRADASIAAIPIIALTALAMEGERERCLAAGANEYLSKPIKFRQLNSAIQRILT
ncbi:MAG: PAS domain S-box protein [Pseudanabaena sp.]